MRSLYRASVSFGSRCVRLACDFECGWIWMTPEEAREILRQRDITFEIRDAQGAYAKAA